jgi:hypothetical protein
LGSIWNQFFFFYKIRKVHECIYLSSKLACHHLPIAIMFFCSTLAITLLDIGIYHSYRLMMFANMKNYHVKMQFSFYYFFFMYEERISLLAACSIALHVVHVHVILGIWVVIIISMTSTPQMWTHWCQCNQNRFNFYYTRILYQE